MHFYDTTNKLLFFLLPPNKKTKKKQLHLIYQVEFLLWSAYRIDTNKNTPCGCLSAQTHNSEHTKREKKFYE